MATDPVRTLLHTYREGLLAQLSLIFLSGTPPLIVGLGAALLTGDMMRPHADDDMWPVLWGAWGLFVLLAALFIWLMRGRRRLAHVYSDGVGLQHRGKTRIVLFTEMAELHNAITKGKTPSGRPRLFVQCEARLQSGEKISFIRHHSGVFDKNLTAFMEALRAAHSSSETPPGFTPLDGP